ncbi:tryptophan halogenase family protein [Hirschia baltica]|uniref:Tryptophan halogenase n=1 Tax=Hirschia baltica (strain ATCC 49814 / DSM 5838 / IFAM 1418) TaxID=582402 RepID=C6XNI6_HIRBI|nr:tryptophan halogenase family protein [Hirschia baltica]ACT60130.1 tryptophan halogenase [Hirschia baltica ATCC 49814]
MNQAAISKIVIVGGGTAGWMAAASLARVLDANRISITLVESESIGSVGVGEATIPPILKFNELLGINEQEFMKATKATFKLGIEFSDWGDVGQKYIHPFGDFGTDIEGIPLHHFWLSQRQRAGYQHSLFGFSLMVKACELGRFKYPEYQNPKSVYSGIHYAYHFDAGLYAAFLRDYAEKIGVVRYEGIVGDVKLDSENGHVKSIVLDDHREIDGELFIDCSGFRGMLIEGALNTGYCDWSHMLPMDSAMAVPSEKVGDPIPYTKAIAHEAGWQWRIPLQHRTGNGCVYSSQFMSDNTARQNLVSGLDGPALVEPKKLQFKTGHRRKFWNKNVIALGLAAGFMEPLESTSISLIQTGLARLMTLMPDKRFSEASRSAYNQRTLEEYEHIRDFLLLHYVASKRNDSEFWQYMRNLPVPASLQEKISLYQDAGRILKFENGLFTPSSWLAVMHGQGIEVYGHDPITLRFTLEETQSRLDGMRNLIDKAALAMPFHSEVLKQLY